VATGLHAGHVAVGIVVLAVIGLRAHQRGCSDRTFADYSCGHTAELSADNESVAVKTGRVPGGDYDLSEGTCCTCREKREIAAAVQRGIG